MSRSHSNIATKRQQFANLQVRRLGGAKQTLCTRCLKTIDKVLAVKTAAKAA
jgi:ribosomal protein L28